MMCFTKSLFFTGTLTVLPEIVTHHSGLWLILSLVVLAATGITVFVLRRKQRKNKKQLQLLEDNLISLRNTLKTLTEESEEMVARRAKAMREELKILRESLQSMQKTLETGQQTAKRNSMLMTKISNTLRTNLNDILGFSDLLAHEFALNEETELFEYNENIRRSGQALMHLLNNIIDISKIESDSFHLNETECNLTEITREVIEDFKPQAEVKGLRIVFEENGQIPAFSADAQAVRHILSNLLDNAIRYTEKGFVKISQSFDEKRITWIIKDTGIGIDKAYLPDIFEPFRQQTLGYTKTTYQGAGLGLPLIKNMLEIMGGSIEIESEKAVGTTVKITFPYKKPAVETAGDSHHSPREKSALTEKVSPEIRHLSGKRLLVLDEDKLENMLIKKILNGMEVITFDSRCAPQEWPEKVLNSGQTPHILLIEMDFSGKNKGLEILKNIRKKFPETKSIPAVALSANLESGVEEKVLKAGFSAFLRKPFRKNELISVINRTFQS
jgi:signal transduction histidine kinase